MSAMSGAANELNSRTVSAGYLRAIYEGVLGLGVPEAELQKIEGLSVNERSRRPQRYTAQALLSLFQKAADHTGDQSVGVRLGLGVRPVRQIDVIYATTFCKNLLEATQLNFKYQPLIQEVGQSHLEIDEQLAYCVFTPLSGDQELYRYITEAIFTGYAMISRWLLWSESPLLKEIRFQHSAPEKVDIYKSVFGDKVIFNATRNEAIADVDALQKPIPGSNPRILKPLISRLDMMMENLKQPKSVTAQCRSLIVDSLGKYPVTIKQVSHRMNMSERNLRRHLNDEGVNFRDLLEQARRDSAAIYMDDPKISLAEIAQELGFNDQSAFSRAFKSWFGQSPAVYRRNS